jgi:hypothetical protein
MSNDLIRYDLLVQDALRGVVRKVLTDAARDGLPGDHHYYVTFRTGAPGVQLSERMRQQYPEEMTIILQHQFWDLVVSETGFEVGLSFSGKAELLKIPFDAVSGFFDPSVQFGLKFEAMGDEEETADAPEAAEPAPVEKAKPQPAPAAARKAEKVKEQPAPAQANKPEPEKPSESGKVVSIDAFRKKT